MDNHLNLAGAGGELHPPFAIGQALVHAMIGQPLT